MNSASAIAPRSGFTLIELSIVMVIIGLIVGGILVGRDLIDSAVIRAQISQIEKYNVAVNTFRNKYNEIPGDMTIINANQLGFTIGTNCNGQAGGRDGNRLIDGYAHPYELCQEMGETSLFWQDLAAARLIEGQYPNSGGQPITCNGSGNVNLSGTSIGEYFPNAKIGSQNYVYVYEINGQNLYGISALTSVDSGGGVLSDTTIPVLSAYRIDSKTDDGIPTAGNVQAVYTSGNAMFGQVLLKNAPNTNTSGGTATSCYDTTTGTYSTGINGGAGANCALSFKFQ